jgi:anti-anti-sigma regulatory factor
VTAFTPTSPTTPTTPTPTTLTGTSVSTFVADPNSIEFQGRKAAVPDQPMMTAPRGSLPGESILTFGVRQGCGFVTLSCQGLTDRQFQQILAHLLELARRVNGNLALDATLVRPFNCYLINALIDFHHRCRGMGGQLILMGLPAEAEEIVVSTGLTKLLKMTTSRDEAIAMFHNQAPTQGLWSRLFSGRRAA